MEGAGGSEGAAGVNAVCKCYYIVGLGTAHWPAQALPVSEGACCQHSTYYFSIWHQETHNARGSCVHLRLYLTAADDLCAMDIKVNDKITCNTSSNNTLVEKNMEDNAP